MANYQQNLLDYITKTISESLNEVQITQAYSLATILEVLQPTHYKTQFFLAKLYFMMEFWSKVEFYSTQAINSLELVDFRNKNEDSLLGDIYYCKLKAQAFLNKPEEIKVTLKLLESKGIYHKILDKINQILPKFDETHLFKYKRLESEQQEEAEKVYEYLRKFKVTPNQDYYIIPTTWFSRWKTFINFEKYIPEPFEEIHHDCMEEEIDYRLGPGPILDENLLESPKGNNTGFPSILHDNEPKFEEFSWSLKPGLVENRDFIIVDMRLFEYLFKKYNGIKLKCSSYIANEGSNTINIETYLKPINFIINPFNIIGWPIENGFFTKYQSKTYLSKRCTIEDLKTKLRNIINLFYIKPSRNSHLSIRLWKLDSCESFNDYFKQLIQLQQKEKEKENTQKTKFLELNAKLLFQDNLILEEADISDEDLILIEIRQEDWSFETPDLKNLDIKKKEPVLTKAGVNFNDLVRHYDIDLKNKYTLDSKNGLVGLQNLGNTCFMNSGLQCLMNSYQLTEYFLLNKFLNEINLKNPLGLKGLNAVTYAALVKDVWQGRKSSVSPWDIKKVISRYSSRFSGYSQQDSQEFISYLLDGLHEDLNRVLNKPVVNEVESKDRCDDIVAEESWEAHLKRNDSIIVDLFHGQFKSKITCPSQSCNKVSITFDPFQMVSMPIPCKEIIKTHFYYVYPYNIAKSPEKMVLMLNGNSSLSELKRIIAKTKQTNEKNLQIYNIQSFVIKEKISEDKDIKYLSDCPGFPFIYDLNIDDKANIDIEQACLLEISINQETTWFYEKDKDITYPRMKYIPLKSNLKNLHLSVYEILRPHFLKLTDIMSSNGSSVNISQEYESKIIKEAIYKLIYVNNKKKTGCLLCGKTSCKGCKVPYENNQNSKGGILLKDISEDGVIRLEVKISKNIKKESLELNLHKEVEIKNQDIGMENNFISIFDCLTQFIQAEKLEKENSWYCSNCKEHKLAHKKMDIYKTSNFLILHLKRFKSTKVSSYGNYFGLGSSTKKINSLISFPLKDLDLSNYILDKKSQGLYDLYAVSNHYGSLEGGHYTAFACNEFDEKWYEFDDAHVRRIAEKDVVTSAAYMLFYKRKGKK